MDIEFHFGSAHFRYDINRDIPDQQKRYLDWRVREDRWKFRPETVIRSILADETKIAFSQRNIAVVKQSARKTLEHILPEAAAGKDVALAVPNWAFWKKLDRGGEYQFKGLFATSAEQFVDLFRKKARKGNLGALLVVDPQTPLGYRITPEAARELDSIALHHGVTVVVDDVLRGSLPIGKRKGVLPYFTKPYVVGSLAKRLGTMLMDYSFVVRPEGQRTSLRSNTTGHDGELLRLAYMFSTKPAYAEISARNEALDQTLRRAIQDVRINRPGNGSLTSAIFIPPSYDTTGEVVSLAAKYEGIEVFAAGHFLPPNLETPPEMRNFLRFSVGGHTREEVVRGVRRLGNIINRYKIGNVCGSY
jgi:hypothetical protein